MKHGFVLLLLCLVTTTRISAQTIQMKVNILDADTVMMLVGGADWTDTLETTNGKFNYSVNLKHPQLLNMGFVKHVQSIQAIKLGNERGIRGLADVQSRELFADSGLISLQGSFAALGSETIQMDKPQLNDLLRSFKKRFNPLVRVVRSIIDSSFTAKKDSEASKVYIMLYKRVLQIEEELALQFAAEQANNHVGAYVLYRYGRSNDVSQLESTYAQFNDRIKRSPYLTDIREKITALKALQPGKKAPDFLLTTDNGKRLTLDSLRGTYVVLDFWGSWCQPCLSGFPDMKSFHKRYGDKLRFVGIACNDTEQNMRKVVKDYGLDWVQAMDPEGESSIAIKYNVSAYPTKILLDPEGKFIKAFVGETMTFYQELEKLLQ